MLTDTHAARSLRLLRALGGISLVDWSFEDERELILAMRAASEGRRYTSPSLLRTMNDRSSPWPEHMLSPTEERMLALFGLGLSDNEAARIRGISTTTAGRHRSTIMRKLDVHTLLDLVRVAARLGYILPLPNGDLAPGLGAVILGFAAE
ncbi:MAG: response regulator transcription factor [Opitutaceae bacterium]